MEFFSLGQSYDVADVILFDLRADPRTDLEAAVCTSRPTKKPAKENTSIPKLSGTHVVRGVPVEPRTLTPGSGRRLDGSPWGSAQDDFDVGCKRDRPPRVVLDSAVLDWGRPSFVPGSQRGRQ